LLVNRGNDIHSHSYTLVNKFKDQIDIFFQRIKDHIESELLIYIDLIKDGKKFTPINIRG